MWVKKNRKYVRYFKENNVFELKLDRGVLKKVHALWEDPGIQNVWSLCRNYQIQVSQLDYFMENIERLTAADYVPNNEDIVRGRQRTAGAYTTRFNNSKSNWEIIDVGGQTPERKKWLHIVQQGFTSIIFFAALDEYNMESSEEPGKTKMEVSMKVFSEVVADEDNFRCCNILFLNKCDLFKEKICSENGYTEFEEKFPDFPQFYEEEFVSDPGLSDEDNKYAASLKHIESTFRELIPDERELVCYPTCAIDTDKTSVVFDAMKEFIFVERMKKSGIKF